MIHSYLLLKDNFSFFFKVIQKFNTFWWWFCFTLLPDLSHLRTHQLLFISLSLQNKQASTKKNKSKRSEKAEQRKPTTRNHITQEKYQWNKITFTKQNKTKNLQKYVGFHFVLAIYFGLETTPDVWYKQLVFFHWWKLFFLLFKHLSIGDCSLLRMGYCFSSGPLYDLDMCRSCACCHSRWEFICTSEDWVLGGTLSKVPSIPSDSCSLSTSSSAWCLYSKGRCLMKTSFLLLGIPGRYTLYCCRSVCTNSNHL